MPHVENKKVPFPNSCDTQMYNHESPFSGPRKKKRKKKKKKNNNKKKKKRWWWW
jgi:hypothetical protein